MVLLCISLITNEAASFPMFSNHWDSFFYDVLIHDSSILPSFLLSYPVPSTLSLTRGSRYGPNSPELREDGYQGLVFVCNTHSTRQSWPEEGLTC